VDFLESGVKSLSGTPADREVRLGIIELKAGIELLLKGHWRKNIDRWHLLILPQLIFKSIGLENSKLKLHVWNGLKKLVECILVNPTD
jgi:hypothetical protein